MGQDHAYYNMAEGKVEGKVWYAWCLISCFTTDCAVLLSCRRHSTLPVWILWLWYYIASQVCWMCWSWPVFTSTCSCTWSSEYVLHVLAERSLMMTVCVCVYMVIVLQCFASGAYGGTHKPDHAYQLIVSCSPISCTCIINYIYYSY